MPRSELTLVLAGILVAAVLLGWALRGIFGRLNGGRRARLGHMAELATRLDAAEEAERRLRAVERDLAAELADARRELAEALRARDAARVELEEIRAAYRRAAVPPA